MIIFCHLQAIGNTDKASVCVPQQLTEGYFTITIIYYSKFTRLQK